jgi:diguanylate cyclase (GGDEF)-like protein/PAS domain S-box-containing protein
MQYDYISPTVLNLLGYTQAELLKLNMRSLILETRIITDGMKTVDSYTELEESRKRGEVNKWQADYLMQTKDGRKIWVSDVSYPWFDKKGAIIGSNGSLRDITERVVAEQKIRNELTKTDYADELTGLANSRKFWLRMEEEIRRTRRTKAKVTVMLITINKLEDIRITYDKKMVEDVFVTIAKAIRKNMREVDIVARIDSESFGVVMPETSVAGAQAAASRLVKLISTYKFFASNPDMEDKHVTVSIGMADSGDTTATNANALYKLADAQLYIACHKGENYISADEA